MKTIFVLALAAILAHSAIALQTPSSLQHKFVSPLYHGIKLLIADERFNAQLTWNQTANYLSEISYVLEKSLKELSHFSPVERLKALNALVAHPNWQHCYKEYELKIARFNREFIMNFNICKQILDKAVAHLEEQTFEQIDFIRNASLEIQRILEACKVFNLKQKNQNHAGITLCVIAHVAEIDQRLLESRQIILDIIAEINVDFYIENHNCLAYNDLKQEFNNVYFAITKCLEEFGV